MSIDRESDLHETHAGDLSAVALLASVLRQSRLLLAFALAGLALAAAVRLLVLRDFVADARFRPQSASGSSGSGLAGVAAQFGISVAAPSEGSPTFYSALVTSRDLMRRAVTSEFRFAAGGDSLAGTLVQLLDVDGDTEEGRTRAAMAELRSRVTPSVDVTTGLVQLRVEMPWPLLAEQVNRRLLDLLGEYNVQVRQSQANAEKRFVEARLEEARQELRAAQTALQNFMTNNLQYQESPRLQFEAQRLQAEVALRNSVYSTLAQSFEQSRIQEVRDTPVITVIEQPESSARPAFPPWWIFGAFGFFAGAAIGVAVGLLREYLRRRREDHPEEFQELSAAMAELRFARSNAPAAASARPGQRHE